MRRGFLEGSQLHTEFGWLCGYLALLGLFYLFHTPFRSHVVVRTDWYARLTRVTQLWSIVVLFFFHRVPVDEHGSRRPSTADSDGDNAELVFFPVFLFMTTFFSLLHKKKRWLRMGVTYGASFLSVILNSLVMAALCTAHYAYTQHLVELVTLSPLWFDEDARKTPWKRFLHWVTNLFYPVPVTTNPLRMTFHLVVTGMIIVYVDYRYKKRCGYDPHAGLLWSDVFEVTKHPANTRGRESGHDVKGDPTADFRYGEQPLQPPGDAYEVSDKIDFSITPSEYTALLEAKYPFNRPAMVSWLTAFAVGAYIQAGLTRLIELVTSETRSAFVHETPKVFSLSLAPRQTGASAVDGKGSAEADHPAVWFDWVADVGDGFNSTYEIARLLAQPRLRFKATAESATDTTAVVPPYALPRGSFVVVGGDLAYPRPTEETYTSRLFEPYRDALSGNPQLRKLFHARQMELIQPDEHDPDLAHIRVLDAETVAATACGADTLRASRGTAEEALHSVPMLFAIPGNHDWFDGLRIFRKYIMDKTWIGGWLMPQQSSFFVLRLPYNWFMLCCDTGTQKDIDVTQRNYFLDVIEKYMDASSCVIVASHEPGWIEDSWPAVVTPTQPQIAKVAQLLGTRLRLRVAGDIHNYSRHAPTVPGSQNPMLVTSGGGGAFMHEVTRAEVVAYGEAYHRVGAFPPSTTLLSFLPRLWGFRIGNWKFDILIGLVCFLSVTPMLLTPALEVEQLPVGTVVEFVQHVACAACQLFVLALAQCGVSLAVFLGFFASFLASTSTGTAPILGRLLYCAFWTLCVSAACYGTLAFLRGAFDLMSRRHLLVSDTQGGSLLEQWVLGSVQAALLAVATWCPPLSHVAQATLAKLNEPRVNALLAVVLRSLDPFEMLRYTTNALHAVQLQQSTAQATPSHPRWGPAAEVLHPRLLSASFYTCYLLFYWMTVIPFVSFIIGCFLFFTTKLFQSVGAYDAAYSSFQIEDYKSFVRFKIDGNTRALHAYTIGVRRVPKLWVRDERFMKPYATDPATRDSSGSDAAVQPPHLQRFPSRWKPSFPELSRTRRVAEGEVETELELPWDKKSTIVDEFVCYPHKPNA